MSSLTMARDERADLLAFLTTLSPEQWELPTLCSGWRVHELVAHVLSYEELGPRRLVERLLRGRFVFSRINDVGVAEYRTRTREELLALLAEHLQPRGLTTMLGGKVALLDGLIHHQDIRRALGLPREVPAERLRRALQEARFAPPLGTPWRTRGLRLVATDLDWSAGSGREVRGPGEALLMAVAGRTEALAELSGPGRAVLADRTGG